MLDELGYDRARGARRAARPTTSSRSRRWSSARPAPPPDERGKVARAIDNRLEKNTPLGIDATLLYGLGRTKGALDQVRPRDGHAVQHPHARRAAADADRAAVGKASLAAAHRSRPRARGCTTCWSTNDPPTHMFTASLPRSSRAKAKAQKDGVF